MEPLYRNNEINILIIDDNPQNVQVIGQMLLNAGYNVSFATSGAEAIEIIDEQQNFDLILLDILMPEMDGFEVCRRIKKNENSSGIPIIFLTAKSDKGSVVQGLKLGANDYISKPFNDNELLLRVKTQIDLLKQREKLKQVNQILEEKVKEKTAQLLQANEKLALLEKAKNDFLTLISHELRTPLNIINGFTEILSDALKDSKHMDELNSLRDSTDQLISLAETALLITEIRLGKYTIDFDSVELAEICRAAATDTQIKFPGKDFSWKVKSEASDNVLSGDEGLLRNIIGKITENSMMACGSECRIEYRISSENGHTILRICDNGPGFSNVDLKKLFDLFSKSGPDIEHEGFGLGLAAVKLAMEIQRGTVSAENLAGGGACVVLTFKPKKN